jgi:hypothetical protein
MSVTLFPLCRLEFPTNIIWFVFELLLAFLEVKICFHLLEKNLDCASILKKISLTVKFYIYHFFFCTLSLLLANPVTFRVSNKKLAIVLAIVVLLVCFLSLSPIGAIWWWPPLLLFSLCLCCHWCIHLLRTFAE